LAAPVAAVVTSSAVEVNTKLMIPPSTSKKVSTDALSPNADCYGSSDSDSKKKDGINGGGKESTPLSSSSAGKSSSPNAKELKYNVSANTLTPGGGDGGGGDSGGGDGGGGDGGSPEVSVY